MKLIAITGGIGSGKSVVCRILSVLGYDVYDCDKRAKAIMDTDEAIKRQISLRISPEAVDAFGRLNREVISSIVFHDKDKLNVLNEIVHAAVRDDLKNWCHVRSHYSLCFVETAILYQSGLDKMVDEVWEVDAPEDVRVERVCIRNGISPEAVRARIDSQAYCPDCPHSHTYTILNDGHHSLLLQINHRLHSLHSLD